jgi:hypothetical protein
MTSGLQVKATRERIARHPAPALHGASKAQRGTEISIVAKQPRRGAARGARGL